MRLESADCVFAKCGDENHGRRHLFAQLQEHFKSAQAGQPDVEQNDVRPSLTDQRHGTRRVLLALDDILYARAANSCCAVFTPTEALNVSESLGSLEARLPAERFVRISRFALVNVAHVTEIEPKSHGDQYLLLRSNKRLIVARTCRSKLLARLKRGS